MLAHLGRAGMYNLQFVSLLIPFMLIWKNKITAITIQTVLFVYGVEWIRTLISIAQVRMEHDQDWIRMAIIIGVVALVNFSAILVFRTKHMKKRYNIS